MRRIRESVKENKFPEFAVNFMRTFYAEKEIPKWVVDAMASVNIFFSEK